MSAQGFAQTTPASPQFSFPHTDAAAANATILSMSAGASPFIEKLTLNLANASTLVSAEFMIQPKAGAASAPVDVTYTNSALVERGYISGSQLTLPVYGLYAGYTNQVTLRFGYLDGSTSTVNTSITTAAYLDPTGIYQSPNIIRQRAQGSSLGFNFIFIKSSLGSPVVIDTDGEIRWVVPNVTASTTSALVGDEFVIGDGSSPVVYRLRLDGRIAHNPLPDASVANFHHNIDNTEIGLLADVTTFVDGVANIETTVAQMSADGSFAKKWDMAAILTAYMQSQGDDAAAFVRPTFDWFHNNSATFDPSDGNIIISSRENFVIKVNYQTGDIIWILGDPTKYWYTFPSLRAKALTLVGGGLYPIGQHGLSMTSKGYLMLFNDGYGSLNTPAGAPVGLSRTYSAVSAYSIDTATMTATNVWNFDNGQTIYSPVCSSAYRATNDSTDSTLVDYATADGVTQVYLLGLDSNRNIAFEFNYPTEGCNTAWNALPVQWENLTIT